MLSVLAGGGLTAGLGGPLAGGALGAEATPAATGPTETPPAPVTGSAGETAGTPQASTEPTTTTSTTPAPTTTTATPPTPVPTPTPAPTAPAGSSQPESAPAIVVTRKQKTTPVKNRNLTKTTVGSAGKGKPGAKAKRGKSAKEAPASGPNGVALAPQVIAGQPNAFGGSLIDPASVALSAQALSFYRIPLFLLPIYQAAAIQYDVPWQVLAAINEVETNYGTDLSVSTAGAVGWMQFEPQTWLQYGVDATRAGNADPYNPVDAIFAAARYLRAAGAGHDLHAAILAYNHSDAYVNSVLLRAKLISSYPQSVIATLTGLTEGRPPIAGFRVAATGTSSAAGPPGDGEDAASPAAAAGAPEGSAPEVSSATANAVPLKAAEPGSPAPGSTPAAIPAASAAQVKHSDPRLVNLMGAKNAVVVAVQDGRVVKLGHSAKLGNYVVLRDVYGDLFTYARLGSIAPTYRLPDVQAKHAATAAKAKASTAAHDPAPRLPASAGHQPPVTLRVRSHARQKATTEASVAPESGLAPAGMLG